MAVLWILIGGGGVVIAAFTFWIAPQVLPDLSPRGRQYVPFYRAVALGMGVIFGLMFLVALVVGILQALGTLPSN